MFCLKQDLLKAKELGMLKNPKKAEEITSSGKDAWIKN